MATLNQISDRPAFAIMNGKTIPFEDAKVSIMAPGLTFAVTVFEGLRGYWQPDEEQLYVFRMEDHLKRQEFSMKIMELEDPPVATDTAGEIFNTFESLSITFPILDQSSIGPFESIMVECAATPKTLFCSWYSKPFITEITVSKTATARDIPTIDIIEIKDKKSFLLPDLRYRKDIKVSK